MAANLDNTLGALFIGMVISAAMFGVTAAQTWFYFINKSKDGLWIKTLVCVVVFLDFFHQLSTTHWLYTLCVTDFGNLQALGVLPWSYYGMAYPTGFVTVLVQSFYVMRIWKLSKNIYLASFVGAVSLTQFASFLYYVARVFGAADAADLSTKLQKYVILVNGLGVATDALIAVCMVYLLNKARTSIKRTNHLLRSLATFSVTTGLLSSFCAIMVLSTALGFPGTNIVLTFYFMLTRLYSNSLLATLNVREHLREKNNSGGIITTSNFIQASHQQSTSHELDNFPRKGDRHNTMHDAPEGGNSVIAVKIDTAVDREYV